MAQAFSFYGQGFSLRGDKGRFVLPPTFRRLVKDASHGERTLCLAKHDRWPCLTGFGMSRLQDFDQQLDREEQAALTRGVEFDRDRRGSQLFGFLDVPFDESGRFVLPDHLASMVDLDGAAFFNGNGPFFTMWNPDSLAAMGEGFEQMQRGCEAFAAEAGRARRK
ncbi:MAG: division/cell wall cluster transcriptional repressor MraZ [Novosphingobium sp.]